MTSYFIAKSVGIDGATLGYEVADVAVRGQDLELLSEVLLDRWPWRATSTTG